MTALLIIAGAIIAAVIAAEIVAAHHRMPLLGLMQDLRHQHGEGNGTGRGDVSHFGSIASNPEHDHAR